MTEAVRSRPRDTDYVQSLARGLRVLTAFHADQPAMTLSEVARATELSPAAARRFLLTLTRLGYVAYDGRRYSLRPRVLELGYTYLSRLTLRDVAQPHLERLAAEVHESSSMSVLDGDDIVYVSRVSTSRIMTISIGLGTRLPAHLTSMGRVLLAHLAPDEREGYLERATLTQRTRRTITGADDLRAELDRVRTQGWSLVDQELEEGLRALAVPVRSRRGVTVGAVNVATHASRSSLDDIRRALLPPLLATAARIEADLRISSATMTSAPGRGGVG
jgi:IclR family pca regulon transcriptional regulator